MPTSMGLWAAEFCSSVAGSVPVRHDSVVLPVQRRSPRLFFLGLLRQAPESRNEYLCLAQGGLCPLCWVFAMVWDTGCLCGLVF